MKTMRLPRALPGGMLSPRARSMWIAVLALSPLAYFGATLLEDKLPHEPKFVSVSKEKAIEVATDFALGLGIDTRGWVPSVSVQHPGDIGALFRKVRPPALERVIAPITIDVLLTGEKIPGEPIARAQVNAAAVAARRDRRWIKVNLTPDGRAIGFSSNKPVLDGASLDEAAARALAEGFLRRRLGPDSPFRLENPKSDDHDPEGLQHEFVWESAVPGLPQGKARFQVDVAGSQITGQTSTVDLDPAFHKTLRPPDTQKIIMALSVAAYFVALGVFALVRYVKRSIEREISHRRTLLVVAIFAISGALNLGVNGVNTNINGAPATGWQAFAILALGLGIPGLLFGVAYGAGEGDLREGFPGKLCSVDAFLSGKIFSANCARSILAGGAFAGWLLLVQNALLLVFHGMPGDASDLISSTLGRSPLASVASNIATDLTIMTAFGLMLPLAALHSRIRDRRALYALLFVLCALAAGGVAANGHSFKINLILIAVFSAAMCAPFLFGDLLAAVSSLTALEFVTLLLRNSAISDQWHALAYGRVLPVGIGFLLVELYFAWRGKTYEESLVRPLYARHLAERLALIAEIGAARLAQVRLLPDAPPRIAGLSIAGSCIPAREVGGDFFDYYALDDHRLGLFLAEGASRELGSAMAIALAKGFLLYTARLDLTPVEILRRLGATLGSVLMGENAPMTVLYAVIDGRNRSIRYARAGASPQVSINGNALAEEIVAGGIEIRHGAATLAPNDALFFYTDGWAGQIVERTRRGPDDFLRNLAREFPEGPADALHQAALRGAMERRRDAPPDDVTAVVVRLEEMAVTEAVGGIA